MPTPAQPDVTGSPNGPRLNGSNGQAANGHSAPLQPSASPPASKRAAKGKAKHGRRYDDRVIRHVERLLLAQKKTPEQIAAATGMKAPAVAYHRTRLENAGQLPRTGKRRATAKKTGKALVPVGAHTKVVAHLLTEEEGAPLPNISTRSLRAAKRWNQANWAEVQATGREPSARELIYIGFIRLITGEGDGGPPPD